MPAIPGGKSGEVDISGSGSNDADLSQGANANLKDSQALSQENEKTRYQIETELATIAARADEVKRQIDLEYYILEDVGSDATHLGDLLQAKRKEGVAVNIIYDSYGSGDTPKAFFDRLRAMGVNLVEFNPMNPLKAKAGYKPNDRDHRKILVVDGRLAIVGGVNLSTDYQNNPIGKSGGLPGEPAPHWRDTDLEISGRGTIDGRRTASPGARDGPAGDPVHGVGVRHGRLGGSGAARTLVPVDRPGGRTYDGPRHHADPSGLNVETIYLDGRHAVGGAGQALHAPDPHRQAHRPGLHPHRHRHGR